jgi:sterol desaturase/sphingolipid hydroxylase (fatty acid hydroxylase superfamily)
METAPQAVRPKHTGQKKLFDNPVLEKLTHTHIAVPITMFVLFSAGLLYYALTYSQLPILLIGALFIVGLLLFTLVEYLVHRYVFHMEPNSPRKAKMQYTIHGVHHEYPKDKTRLAMPPLMSALLALFLLWLTTSLMGEYAYAFLPGFVMGYSGYLFVHYITHAYPPPDNLFRILWVNHSVHHYKSQNKAFGVSSPLWDYVFGTLP